MAADKLVDEVFALAKPVRFQPMPVDDIVKKYITPGIDRSRAHELLKEQGFSTSDHTLSAKLEACPDCDLKVVHARYDHRPWYAFLPDYAVTVRLGLKDERVVSIQGWYVKSMP